MYYVLADTVFAARKHKNIKDNFKIFYTNIYKRNIRVVISIEEIHIFWLKHVKIYMYILYYNTVESSLFKIFGTAKKCQYDLYLYKLL